MEEGLLVTKTELPQVAATTINLCFREDVEKRSVAEDIFQNYDVFHMLWTIQLHFVAANNTWIWNKSTPRLIWEWLLESILFSKSSIGSTQAADISSIWMTLSILHRAESGWWNYQGSHCFATRLHKNPKIRWVHESHKLNSFTKNI